MIVVFGYPFNKARANSSKSESEGILLEAES